MDSSPGSQELCSFPVWRFVWECGAEPPNRLRLSTPCGGTSGPRIELRDWILWGLQRPRADRLSIYCSPSPWWWLAIGAVVCGLPTPEALSKLRLFVYELRARC